MATTKKKRTRANKKKTAVKKVAATTGIADLRIELDPSLLKVAKTAVKKTKAQVNTNRLDLPQIKADLRKTALLSVAIIVAQVAIYFGFRAGLLQLAW